MSTEQNDRGENDRAEAPASVEGLGAVPQGWPYPGGPVEATSEASNIAISGVESTAGPVTVSVQPAGDPAPASSLSAPEETDDEIRARLRNAIDTGAPVDLNDTRTVAIWNELNAADMQEGDADAPQAPAPGSLAPANIQEADPAGADLTGTPTGGRLEAPPQCGPADAMVMLRPDAANPLTIHAQVLIGADEPDLRNVAHFFAHWLNRNLPQLIAISQSEYNLLGELRSANERHALHLVAPDGSRLN